MVINLENNLMDNRALILSKMKAGAGISVNRTNGLNKDEVNISPNNNKSNPADDGKITFKEKMQNFGKGLIAPIKTIFASPKNMVLTALAGAGTAALIAVTGGAAAPVLVAAGLACGGIQIGKGIYNQVKAKTDDEARKAWQTIGTGTFTVGTSAVAAKSALKVSGVDTKGMSVLSAIKNCITSVPKNISKSISNISMFIKSSIPSSSTASVIKDNPNNSPNKSSNNSSNNNTAEVNNNSPKTDNDIIEPKNNITEVNKDIIKPNKDIDIIECVDYRDLTDYSSVNKPAPQNNSLIPTGSKQQYSPFSDRRTIDDYFVQQIKDSYLQQQTNNNSGQLLLAPGVSKKSFLNKLKDFFELFGIFFKKDK